MTALTGVAGTGHAGSVGSPNISIALTGVQATGAVGFPIASKKPGESWAVSQPMPRVALTGLAGNFAALLVAAPVPRVSLQGATALLAALQVRKPATGVVLAGVTGAVGTLAVKTPVPLVALREDGTLTVKVPSARVALTGATGAIGLLSVRLPLAQPAFSASTPTLGTLAVVAPLPKIGWAAQGATTGALAAIRPNPRVALAGLTGASGVLAVLVPAARLALTGGVSALGTLAVRVPVPRVRLAALAAAQAAASDPTALNTIAINTERLALTQYTNFQFNSYAAFAGKYLGANGSGIYELAGASDAGAPIQSAARVGISDFNTSRLKRVDRVYVGYRADARLILRIFTDEVTQRDYAVPAYSIAGLHGAHVRVGHGLMARYWQFELRNENGGDFSVDMIELKPTEVRRRVGGSDA